MNILPVGTTSPDRDFDGKRQTISRLGALSAARPSAKACGFSLGKAITKLKPNPRPAHQVTSLDPRSKLDLSIPKKQDDL